MSFLDVLAIEGLQRCIVYISFAVAGWHRVGLETITGFDGYARRRAGYEGDPSRSV